MILNSSYGAEETQLRTSNLWVIQIDLTNSLFYYYYFFGIKTSVFYVVVFSNNI